MASGPMNLTEAFWRLSRLKRTGPPRCPRDAIVCKRLKADERARDIPVIVLSALDDVRDKIKTFQVGGAGYITKPLREEEAPARVETHQSQGRMS